MEGSEDMKIGDYRPLLWGKKVEFGQISFQKNRLVSEGVLFLHTFMHVKRIISNHSDMVSNPGPLGQLASSLPEHHVSL